MFSQLLHRAAGTWRSRIHGRYLHVKPLLDRATMLPSDTYILNPKLQCILPEHQSSQEGKAIKLADSG